ncbi:SM-like, degradation of cytoplasmic mRNAs and positively regulates transcription initiation, partial [Tulasnella sp. 427]
MDSLIPFTTSGSLVDSVDNTETDKDISYLSYLEFAAEKMLVVLRDGRKLIGVLRSYDQYANLVLEDTVERMYHESTFGEIRKGIFVIRGENVVLLGEVDLDKEDNVPLKQVSMDQIIPMNRLEQEQRK